MSKAEKEVGGKGFSGPIVEKSSKQQMLSKNLSSGVEGDLSIILFCTSLGKLLLTDLESIEQKYISCWLSITDLLVGDICRMYRRRNHVKAIFFVLLGESIKSKNLLTSALLFLTVRYGRRQECNFLDLMDSPSFT